jgi:hypothetical protein
MAAGPGVFDAGGGSISNKDGCDLATFKRARHAWELSAGDPPILATGVEVGLWDARHRVDAGTGWRARRPSLPGKTFVRARHRGSVNLERGPGSSARRTSVELYG